MVSMPGRCMIWAIVPVPTRPIRLFLIGVVDPSRASLGRYYGSAWERRWSGRGVEVEHSEAGRLGLFEADDALEARDGRGRGLGAAQDVLGQRGRLALEHLGQHLAVAPDRGELVVQLVGDQAGGLDRAVEA